MNRLTESSVGRASRRKFLGDVSTLGAASVLGFTRAAAAAPPPEVKNIRLFKAPITCLAPQYLAEQFLHLEGFSHVEYVPGENRAETGPIAVAADKVDLSMWDALHSIEQLDMDKPLVLLAGVHVGCWELFANDRVHNLRDLKGKTIAIWGLGQGDHILLSSMLSYVGMDPRKDIDWLPGEDYDAPMRLFLEGKADAFMGFAPQPQEMRAKAMKARVLINTAQDKPWSQYFCCMVSTNRTFLQHNPIATKRALRAILKATDICAQDPERAARYITMKGYERSYELGLEVMREVPYRRWRESNPEDTLRFYGLRLREVGMIKSTPQKLIAQGTDWRFLDELKKELKA